MDKLFQQAPEPKTPLGRYRVFGEHCGLRVSPLQLGAMSIGEAWTDFMGSMDKEQSFKLLDAFLEAGGNMIDTANNYQNEESEAWIGEWMESRGVRDRVIVATKFTTNYKTHVDGLDRNDVILYGGNHKRSLHMSVRDSLKKLKTEWIDVLYLHWWDFSTSIKEVMDSLHVLVEQGKVLYLGISDTPAWVVAAANQYAIDNGKTPFCVYQGRWNVMIRDFERDIIPMCRQFGMALAPWDAIGSGKLLTQKQLDERKKAGEKFRSGGHERTETEIKYAECLAGIAAEHGIESVTAVALAYLMAKTPYVFPIVGGRKVEHLHDNIQSLKLKLTQDQVDRIDGVQSFEPGFPHNFCGTDPTLPPSQHQPKNWILPTQGTIDFLAGAKPPGRA